MGFRGGGEGRGREGGVGRVKREGKESGCFEWDGS